MRYAAKVGRMVDALLRSANVSAQITEAQSAQAIDAAVARLTAAGLSAETVQALAGSSLTRQAIDVLAQLE